MFQKREYKWGIQTKLSLASGLLVLISLASFGIFSYLVTRRTLDDQMGERLVSHAEMAAFTLQRDAQLLREMSDLGKSFNTRLQSKLADAREAAGLDNVILISVDSKVLVDAKGEVGEQYPILEADEVELELAWRGYAQSSVLYKGKDEQLYKAAYAPLMTANGREVVAVLRVEAKAGFLNTIHNVGLVFLSSAIIITALAALLSRIWCAPLSGWLKGIWILRCSSDPGTK